MVFVNNSAILSYAHDNHWKFNFTSWKEITDIGLNKYEVPFVTTFNFTALLNNMKKWGCQPEIYIER